MARKVRDDKTRSKVKLGNQPMSCGLDAQGRGTGISTRQALLQRSSSRN